MHPIILIVLSLASAWFLHFSYRLYKQRISFKGLPGPPHDFLFGHLKAMGEVAATLPPNCHPQLYITSLAQKYNLKGIFYLDLWPIADSQVILTDPGLMDKVTLNPSLPMHRVSDAFLSPIVGHDVIATSNGEVWKKTHLAMQPAFSWTSIRNQHGVMIDEVQRFRSKLDQLVDSGEVFSMEKIAAKLVFDVIARIVFNFSLHAQTQGCQELEDLHEMIALSEAQLSFNPLIKAKAWWRKRTVLPRLDRSMLEKIKERLSLLRREKIVPSRKDPFSILDLMLREQVEEDSKMGREVGSVDEIAPKYKDLLLANIKGLLLGGHGTTTDTLCYIYTLLSTHPQVLAKMREEHSKVFAATLPESLDILTATPSKLQDLDYTEAVIKETLRLFPVGFGLRVAPQGATLAYKGRDYPIDNNLAIIPLPHTLHYDDTYFPSPSSFQPKRFINDGVPRGHFRTFGRGPRACLGQNLAQDELKIILLMTVRDYDFELADVKPNEKPKASYTDLDTVYGDIVFQELRLEAAPRGGMMMRARKVE